MRYWLLVNTDTRLSTLCIASCKPNPFHILFVSSVSCENVAATEEIDDTFLQPPFLICVHQIEGIECCH